MVAGSGPGQRGKWSGGGWIVARVSAGVSPGQRQSDPIRPARSCVQLWPELEQGPARSDPPDPGVDRSLDRSLDRVNSKALVVRAGLQGLQGLQGLRHCARLASILSASDWILRGWVAWTASRGAEDKKRAPQWAPLVGLVGVFVCMVGAGSCSNGYGCIGIL